MKKFLLTSFLLIYSLNYAQQNWLSGNFVSNSQYYVDDSKTGDFNESDRFRSNNYLKLDAAFKNFTFGLQAEGYAPQSLLNFPQRFNKDIGLATYYVNYKSSKLDATAGYFYEQFGSGLILRSWEDKQLGLNNALRGGRIAYTPFSYLQFTGIYGKHRVGFTVSEGETYGFDSNFNLSEALKIEKMSLTLGFSIVNRTQNIAATNPNFNNGTNAYSGRINFNKNNFYTNLEYVLKSEDALVEFGYVNTNSLAKGNALLLNLGYSQKGLGINTTFRRLENMSFYANREEEGNIDNELLVNYLPSLTKQHDYGLANIYVYQTQSRLTYNPIGKAGEIGFQADVFFNAKRGTKIGGKYGTKFSLNYATWYGLDATFDIANRTYSANFLSFGKKYFTDFNIEIIKKWNKKWSSTFSYINLFYNKKYIEETSGKVNANIAAVEAIYKFLKTKSVKMNVQHLWTKEDKKNWVAGLFELNLSSKISFFASDLYNYGNDIKKIHYYNVGTSFTKNSTRLALSYGRQRGGLLCVGGVCRIVPESTGFGLTVNTSF
ncbi:DUF6029 family protein [Lutibacter sp.]